MVAGSCAMRSNNCYSHTHPGRGIRSGSTTRTNWPNSGRLVFLRSTAVCLTVSQAIRQDRPFGRHTLSLLRGDEAHFKISDLTVHLAVHMRRAGGDNDDVAFGDFVAFAAFDCCT